jgi:hypothetical protein
VAGAGVSASTILEELECDRGGCDCHSAARRGRGNTHCPAHVDSKPSLTVSEGSDGKVLFHCQGGCEQSAVLEELKVRGLWSSNGAWPKGGGAGAGRRIARTHDYVDADGRLVCQTVRYHPKEFKQRRPNPDEVGSWIWNLGPIHQRLVLYRLPAILKADTGRTVFVTEGEKDADRLTGLGLLATTNAMGAGKWYQQYTQTLKGRSVALLADNDPAGSNHVAKVAEQLLRAGCTVRIVRFPELPDKGDVSDWLDAGHTVEELKERVKAVEPERPRTGGPYRLQCEKSDPPMWLEHWPRGVVRVANDDLRNPDATLRAFTAQLKCSPGWGAGISRGQFEEHIFKLLAEMDSDPDGYVEVTETRTWAGRVRLLLVQIARIRPGRPCRIDGDRFYFNFGDLVRLNAEDVNTQKGIDRERMRRPELQTGVENLGGLVGKGREESWVPLAALALPEDVVAFLMRAEP